MIYILDGLYVIVEQLETPLAPQPKPLNHGFSRRTAYLVLGVFSLAESADAFFILSNDRDELWFISNRHLRTYTLRPGATDFRIPFTRVADFAGASKENGARHDGNKSPRKVRGRLRMARRNSAA